MPAVPYFRHFAVALALLALSSPARAELDPAIWEFVEHNVTSGTEESRVTALNLAATDAANFHASDPVRLRALIDRAYANSPNAAMRLALIELGKPYVEDPAIFARLRESFALGDQRMKGDVLSTLPKSPALWPEVKALLQNGIDGAYPINLYAIDTLRQYPGAEAVAMLRQPLRSIDEMTSHRASYALEAQPKEDVLRLAREVIGSRASLDEQVAVFKAVGSIKDPETLLFLEKAAASREPRFRRAAAWALGGRGPAEQALFSKLLQDPEVDVRAGAMMALEEADLSKLPDPEPLFLQTLRDPDGENRMLALLNIVNEGQSRSVVPFEEMKRLAFDRSQDHGDSIRRAALDYIEDKYPQKLAEVVTELYRNATGPRDFGLRYELAGRYRQRDFLAPLIAADTSEAIRTRFSPPASPCTPQGWASAAVRSAP